MLPINWNPLDNAEEHRAVAIDRRNRGLATGKAAAGWAWKRPDPGKGTFDRLAQEVTAGWQWARGEAIEDYRLAVFPERFEPLDDCPF